MTRPIRVPANRRPPVLRSDLQLLTFADLEHWPAMTLRARSNLHARRIALADGVIRSAGLGHYLAVTKRIDRNLEIRALGRFGTAQTQSIRQWQATLKQPSRCLAAPKNAKAYCHALGIAKSELRMSQLPQLQPTHLRFAGWDRYARALWLTEKAALAWQRMHIAARHCGIELQAISGFRSYAYQHVIFVRKRQRGQSLREILRVNTAPGFSEHHTGRALDIGCPDEPPAEISFENTRAFEWLCTNARRFGFSLSYPKGNPFGIDYEPWHWCWHEAHADRPSEGFP